MSACKRRVLPHAKHSLRRSPHVQTTLGHGYLTLTTLALAQAAMHAYPTVRCKQCCEQNPASCSLTSLQRPHPVPKPHETDVNTKCNIAGRTRRWKFRDCPCSRPAAISLCTFQQDRSNERMMHCQKQVQLQQVRTAPMVQQASGKEAGEWGGGGGKGWGGGGKEEGWLTSPEALLAVSIRLLSLQQVLNGLIHDLEGSHIH